MSDTSGETIMANKEEEKQTENRQLTGGWQERRQEVAAASN